MRRMGGRVTWLTPRFDTIPPELRALGWVLWRAEPRGDGKPTKVPYCVADPSRKASSTDPSTWATFTDAIEAYAALDVAGVGVVLTEPAGITCIDLDRVIDPYGQLDLDAQAVVDRAKSWTGISPGGKGLHIFARGKLPAALKGDRIEIYSTARYIAVTGHRWPGTTDTVQSRQTYLNALDAKARAGYRPRPAYTGPPTPAPDDLAGALLARLQAWSVPVARLKRWEDGFLVELVRCPWADEHTTGAGGAAVMIRASGAFDFVCQHAHCVGRRWREFRNAVESSQ
jgi:hypothetical protein